MPLISFPQQYRMASRAYVSKRHCVQLKYHWTQYRYSLKQKAASSWWVMLPCLTHTVNKVALTLFNAGHQLWYRSNLEAIKFIDVIIKRNDGFNTNLTKTNVAYKSTHRTRKVWFNRNFTLAKINVILPCFVFWPLELFVDASGSRAWRRQQSARKRLLNCEKNLFFFNVLSTRSPGNHDLQWHCLRWVGYCVANNSTLL